MNAYRQPKTSYKFFETQRPINQTNEKIGGGAIVYIANEMTPFSPEDVTIFSNCEEVRVKVYNDGELQKYSYPQNPKHPISMPIVFKDLLKWSDLRLKYKARDDSAAYIVAEGLIDGKVVATQKKSPAGRAEKIIMWVDNDDTELIADGSDKVVVVAAIADGKGRIRRLDKHFIKFSISGEGMLVTNNECSHNPKAIEWGTAPIIVQSTDKVGKITVYAEVMNKGENQPISGSVTFMTVPNPNKVICDKSLRPSFENKKASITSITEETYRLKQENERLRKMLIDGDIKKTEILQKEFQTF